MYKEVPLEFYLKWFMDCISFMIGVSWLQNGSYFDTFHHMLLQAHEQVLIVVQTITCQDKLNYKAILSNSEQLNKS